MTIVEIADLLDSLESPAAENVYWPKRQFLSDDHPTYRSIEKALKANPWIRTRRPLSKKGTPIPNRLEIHTGDWKKYLSQSRSSKVRDFLDQPAATVDAVLDLEQRKAAERYKRESR
jgi:hypothetical protein